MRAIWSGSISFGLLQVPVQLYSATRDLDVHFRLLDSRDKKPIRYERVNTETGEEVPWKQIVKAYEVKKGSYVIVDEKELKRAAPEQTETIDLESFVDRCDVDPIYFSKPYYVAPGKRAQKGYVLLREALAKSGKIGICRVVIRTRQHLAALHPEGEALMLTLMRFDEEIVTAKDVGLTASTIGKPKIAKAELNMAEKLLEAMTSEWKPEAHKEEFRTKLREHLERRAEHGEAVEEPVKHPAPKEGKVIDLMSVLKQSLGEKKAPARRTKPARRRVQRKRAS